MEAMVKVLPLGHSCFKISGKGGSIVVDPFYPEATGLSWKRQKADLVLVSCDLEEYNNIEGVGEVSYVATGPGEYEVSGTKVLGIRTGGGNTVYEFTVDEVTFLHLGGLNRILNEEELQEISEIDVLFVPTGGVEVLDFEKAAQVVAQIEPRLVVPMHYQGDTEELSKYSPVEKFIEEMGEELERRAQLKFKSRADLPEETEVIVLVTQ